MSQAASQLPRENLMQQRFFQIIQRGGLALIGGFEASVVVRGIFLGRLDVVDRARTNDDEQAMILAVEDVPHRLAPLQHRRLRAFGQRQRALHLLQCRQRVLRQHIEILLTGSLAMGDA